MPPPPPPPPPWGCFNINMPYYQYTMIKFRPSHDHLFFIMGFILYNRILMPKWGSWSHLSINMPSYRYKNSHYKGNMVLWPSYLYNGNPIHGKSILILFLTQKKLLNWGLHKIAALCRQCFKIHFLTKHFHSKSLCLYIKVKSTVLSLWDNCGLMGNIFSGLQSFHHYGKFLDRNRFMHDYLSSVVKSDLAGNVSGLIPDAAHLSWHPHAK